MESKKFDHIIKSKLQELDHVPMVSDWEVFHGKYKDELENSEGWFDEAILNKFNNPRSLDSVLLASDWDNFHAKYKTELESPEGLFDQAIQDKFHNLEVPYNESHWLLMKEELEKEEFIRTSIYFSKIVEAACVFLILFTFLNIYPSLSSDKYETSEIVNRTIIQDDAALDNTIEFESSLQNNEHTIEQPSVLIPFNNDDLQVIDNVLPRFEEPVNLSVQNNNTRTTEKVVASIPSLSIEKQIIVAPHNSTALLEIEKSTNLNSFFVDEGNGSEMLSGSVAMLDDSDIEPLEMRRSFYRQVLPIQKDNQAGKESFVSFNIAPTVNIVNSPFDYVNKTAPYNTDAVGGELGINYSVRKNNFEIETGINFARKSYAPRQVDEVIGSFFTSFRRLRLRQITYDVMSIPVSAKLHFANGNGWSLYALAGTSINGIANSDYLVEENGKKISIYEVQTNYRSSNTARKNYDPGIFEGGNVLDNIYFTLDFGIGMEHRIGESTIFYVAPTLRQHIGLAGVGPNNDKVNSLGLNLGIKKRL